MRQTMLIMAGVQSGDKVLFRDRGEQVKPDVLVMASIDLLSFMLCAGSWGTDALR